MHGKIEILFDIETVIENVGFIVNGPSTSIWQDSAKILSIVVFYLPSL